MQKIIAFITAILLFSTAGSAFSQSPIQNKEVGGQNGYIIVFVDDDPYTSWREIQAEKWETETRIAQAETAMLEAVLLTQIAELCQTATSELCSPESRTQTRAMLTTWYQESLLREANIERWVQAREKNNPN